MPQRLRLLIDAACDAATNMAVDHALLESVQQGGPAVLRLYRWSPAALSLGRNQRAAGVYDAARIAAAGCDVVRRPTGGLAVLHDDERTYAVAARFEHFGGPLDAYVAIHRGLLAGLRALGVEAGVAERATPGARVRAGPHAPPPPCFADQARGEIVADGGKLVGSAQRCERRALLQHGSILIDGDQSRIEAFRAAAAPEAPAGGPPATVHAVPADAGAVTLRLLLGRAPDDAALVAALADGVAATLDTRVVPDTLTGAERRRVRVLADRYRDPAWTWRR
jgi:lipoate-protein ligase A